MRRYVIVIAVCACAVLGGYASDTAAQPSSLEPHYYPPTFKGRAVYYLKRGNNRFELGDFSGATADFMRGLKFNPHSIQLQIALKQARQAAIKRGDWVEERKDTSQE